jgi:hypothetical protein
MDYRICQLQVMSPPRGSLHSLIQLPQVFIFLPPLITQPDPRDHVLLFKAIRCQGDGGIRIIWGETKNKKKARYVSHEFGWRSSIHLLGRFSTTIVRGLEASRLRSLSPSAKRPRWECAGHGSISDADTVKTQARNVRPKSEEVSERARRVVRRNARWRGENIV